MEREKVMAVQRVQDYILNHIYESISLKQLSKAARYSPWHTSRIFKELIGKTLFEYIRVVRLSKAAMILRDDKRKVIDVAFDFVFDSHEGFTRSFSKNFGISPFKYKKTTPPIRLFMPMPIKDYYLYLKKGDDYMKTKEKISTVFAQVVERPRRKLLFKRGIKATEYFAYCEEVGCDIWGILCSVKEALYEPIGLWLPKKLTNKGTSKYVQGVELPLDYNNSVPKGFEIIELDSCKMMIFNGQPYEEDEDFMEEIKVVKKAIETYDPNIYGYEWADDDAPRFQLEPQGYRGYIEGRPVKFSEK